MGLFQTVSVTDQAMIGCAPTVANDLSAKLLDINGWSCPRFQGTPNLYPKLNDCTNNCGTRNLSTVSCSCHPHTAPPGWHANPPVHIHTNSHKIIIAKRQIPGSAINSLRSRRLKSTHRAARPLPREKSREKQKLWTWNMNWTKQIEASAVVG
jgi:hypothetical protein